MPLNLSVVILTHNENLHIQRCIESLAKFVSDVYVVDSYSSDNTAAIAETFGAKVYKNPWPGNQALQFNWALQNLPITSEWILRLDADEYLLPELREEISQTLPKLSTEITGIFLRRRVYFMGYWIRYGGYYPTNILRIWRKQAGKLEDKWMDEHVKLDYGKTISLKHDFVDDNQNDLTWWTHKHNLYATREATELLNLEYHFLDGSQIDKQLSGSSDKRKRWLKDILYTKIPLFVRPFIYFFYRYIIKLGFLDGTKGLVWHFLQGFWYRFLVDAKIYDIKRRAKSKDKTLLTVLESYLGHRLK